MFSLYFHQKSGRKIEKESRYADYLPFTAGKTVARALQMGMDLITVLGGLMWL